MINKKIFFPLMLITAISMCAGAFFEVFMEGVGKEELMELLSSHFSVDQSFGFISILKNSFLSQIKTWFILFMCPIIPILALICPFICITKGLSVGFSSTMLVETFGFKGAFYILTTIMPQNLIQIPIFCLLSTLSIQMSVLVFNYYVYKTNRKRNKNALQIAVRHYLTIFAYSLAIMLASSLIEAFLKQFLL